MTTKTIGDEPRCSRTDGGSCLL